MIFANPIFLWGLLALLIPIAVHFFNFRRYRKVYFSNVDRLMEVKTEKRKVSQLRRWLVLLMRCLAIAALVLAFAQPTLPGSGQQLQPGITAVSVYIDNSFSMENSGSDGSQLETAKQKAREIVAAYRPGDRFQLLSNTLAGEEFRWLSREEFLDAVDALQVNPASRRLSEVAQRQADFLGQSNAANCHAYIVSDFQTSAADLTQNSEFRIQNSEFTLVPLEGIATDNIYIDTLTLDAPAYFVGGSVTAEATLRNDGSRDVEKLPVKLFVNGRERALATIDLPAGSSAKASLRFTIDSAGWLNGRVEISDYPVTFDDNYYFSLLAGERIEMLQVGENNENLEKLFSSDSTVHYQFTQTFTQSSNQTSFNFLLLNEVTDLPSGQAQSIAAWVAEGGALAIVPPANGHVEQLNALLALLNGPRLDSWTSQSVRASKVDFQSSLYRQVFNQSTASQDMELPSVQGHYLLNTSQSLCQPIITLADGSLLLGSVPHGAGRLYLFSTPLTAQYTDFVSQALFVPTLYNMPLYSRPLPPASYTLGGSDPIFLQHSYDPSAPPPQLTQETTQSDNQAILPDIRRVGSRSAMIPHGELTLAGHYRLGDEYLAFNYDRSESQLRFLTPQQVDSAFDGREGYTVVRNAAKPLDREIRARRNGTPLWHWFILAALAALLAETLILKVPKVLKDLKDPKA